MKGLNKKLKEYFCLFRHCGIVSGECEQKEHAAEESREEVI